MTVNKAVKRLEEVDAVYRIPRKGTYVKRHYCFAMCFNDPNPNILMAPVYNQAVMAAQRYLNGQNCPMFLEGSVTPSDHMVNVLRRRVDGFLLIYNPEFGLAQDIMKHPSVRIFGVPDPTLYCDHVTYDNELVGRLAAEYILDRGCKRIAYIGKSDLQDGVFHHRVEAFRKRLTEGGGTLTVFETPWTNDFTAIDIQLTQILAMDPRPDGLFVAADGIASAVVTHLYRLNIHIGKDLQLISCDNVAHRDPFLPWRFPSIDICSGQIGEMAARQIIERVMNPDMPRTVKILTPRLVLPS